MPRAFRTSCPAALFAVLLIGSCSRDVPSPVAPQLRASDMDAARNPTLLQEPIAIADDSLPNGNVGAEYTAFLTSSGGEGTPHLFKVIDGKLPRGLKMERSFGVQSTVIHGVPTEVGSSTFTVRVQDQARNTASKTFTITIDPPTPVEITNPSPELRAGTVGEPYVANLFASGGVRPYDWAVIAGTLPPGLQLNGNVIEGTPTTSGIFPFTAQITDDVGQQDTMEFSITVN